MRLLFEEFKLSFKLMKLLSILAGNIKYAKEGIVLRLRNRRTIGVM
ncbi:hypothetical protein [Saccharolobus solfataricus]|nr:hypothetical protein [Saccharolobus solfataricus]